MPNNSRSCDNETTKNDLTLVACDIMLLIAEKKWTIPFLSSGIAKHIVIG